MRCGFIGCGADAMSLSRGRPEGPFEDECASPAQSRVGQAPDRGASGAARFRITTVSSGVVPNRTGGPQVPVPALT